MHVKAGIETGPKTKTTTKTKTGGVVARRQGAGKRLTGPRAATRGYARSPEICEAASHWRKSRVGARREQRRPVQVRSRYKVRNSYWCRNNGSVRLPIVRLRERASG